MSHNSDDPWEDWPVTTKFDYSVGRNERGEKLYIVQGCEHPQVLHGIKDLRIIKRRRFPESSEPIFRLQFRHRRRGNGEMTEYQWVDLPVYDEEENFLGYDV